MINIITIKTDLLVSVCYCFAFVDRNYVMLATSYLMGGGSPISWEAVVLSHGRR